MRDHLLSTTCLLALGVVAGASANTCQSGYTVCAPAGATSTSTPEITSNDFSNLLNNLLGSSLPPLNKRGTASLCCVSSLSCLTLANLEVPFCYDRFTTNYFLPDNSYGTVSTGAYTNTGGDEANLLTGDYTLANGQKGNIYAKNPAAKPNTATLALPAQFTGSGVGSAIPATALGGLVTLTLTTTLPGTTFAGTTISPTTVSPSTIAKTLTSPTLTTTTSTAALTTIAGTTKLGTTVAALVTTLTTTSAVAGTGGASTSASASASASTTTKSAASGPIYGLDMKARLLIVAALLACWT